MEKYNFIVYDNKTGFIQQMTNTGASYLPTIPVSDPVTAIHVNFFNDNITECYYDSETRKFYEDAEKNIEIMDPSTYIKSNNSTEPELIDNPMDKSEVSG